MKYFKKFLLLLIAYTLCIPFSYATISVEEVVNNVYDSTNTALKATISGNASMDALTADTLYLIEQSSAPGTPVSSRGVLYTLNSDNKLYYKNDAGTATTLSERPGSISFSFDGGGAAISTGTVAWVKVPFACTIDSFDLTADQSGSCVIDIWKDVFANFPPTTADTITAGNRPDLTSEIKTQDTTLTSWTTSISANDYIYVTVDSCTTSTKLNLTLGITKQ